MSEQCTSKLGWIALDTWSWGVCMREWIPEQCAAGGEVEDSRAAGWPATGVEVDHHGGRARMATEESTTRRLRPCRSLSTWPMPCGRRQVIEIEATPRRQMSQVLSGRSLSPSGAQAV
jgi:hypothetical protein